MYMLDQFEIFTVQAARSAVAQMVFLLEISTRLRVLQSVLDPVREPLGIHFKHIVNPPDTLGRKCLLVHMDVSIVGAAV